MQSVRIEPDDQLWQTLVDHLIESGDAHWDLDSIPKSRKPPAA